MPLHAWRLPREEPRRRLHELERTLDMRAKLRGQLQLAVGDEGKFHASTSQVIAESHFSQIIAESDFERNGRCGGGCHEDATVAIRLQEGHSSRRTQPCIGSKKDLLLNLLLLLRNRRDDERVGVPSEIDGNLPIAAFMSQLQEYGGLGRSSMNGCVIIIWTPLQIEAGSSLGSLSLRRLCAIQLPI